MTNDKYNPDYNPPGYDAKKDSVELMTYNPEWQELAEKEIQHIQNILPTQHIIAIHHIGSTAIPGMVAKPIIDIQLVVDELENIKDDAIRILEGIGYAYWYGNPDPQRMFFVKGMPPLGTGRTHHIHIFPQHSTLWRDKLEFKNYLCQHPEIAKEYAALKLRLKEAYGLDRERYTDEKKTFVERVLKLARGNK